MPLYSYRCSGCGESFEVLQKTPQASGPGCPHCKSAEVTRLPALPADPVVRNNNVKSCCSNGSGCDNPRRCCEKR